LTVFGEFEPKNAVGHRVDTQKAHNACFEPSCVKFHARVTSVGESGEKIKIKKRGLIFHVFRQSLPYADWHKFWVTCSSRGRSAKFYRNRLRGVDYVRGRSLTISIGLRCRR